MRQFSSHYFLSQTSISLLTTLRTSFVYIMISRSSVTLQPPPMYVPYCCSSGRLPNKVQEDVVIVGRITHDAESAAMSKLAEGAITIESSRALSSGSRVPLVLDPTIKIKGSVKGVGGAGIYPGAIVALRGKNGGGGYFLATEVLSVSQSLHIHFLFTHIWLDPATQAVACGSWNRQPQARSDDVSTFGVYDHCLWSIHFRFRHFIPTVACATSTNKSCKARRSYACAHLSSMPRFRISVFFYYLGWSLCGCSTPENQSRGSGRLPN